MGYRGTGRGLKGRWVDRVGEVGEGFEVDRAFTWKSYGSLPQAFLQPKTLDGYRLGI